MFEETDSIADAFRDSLETEDGTRANFATFQMLSRLLQGGYGDAFSLSDPTQMRAAFAENVPQFVEDEMVASFDFEN